MESPIPNNLDAYPFTEASKARIKSSQSFCETHEIPFTKHRLLLVEFVLLKSAQASGITDIAAFIVGLKHIVTGHPLFSKYVEEHDVIVNKAFLRNYLHITSAPQDNVQCCVYLDVIMTTVQQRLQSIVLEASNPNGQTKDIIGGVLKLYANETPTDMNILESGSCTVPLAIPGVTTKGIEQRVRQQKMKARENDTKTPNMCAEKIRLDSVFERFFRRAMFANPGAKMFAFPLLVLPQKWVDEYSENVLGILVEFLEFACGVHSGGLIVAEQGGLLGSIGHLHRQVYLPRPQPGQTLAENVQRPLIDVIAAGLNFEEHEIPVSTTTATATTTISTTTTTTTATATPTATTTPTPTATTTTTTTPPSTFSVSASNEEKSTPPSGNSTLIERMIAKMNLDDVCLSALSEYETISTLFKLLGFLYNKFTDPTVNWSKSTFQEYGGIQPENLDILKKMRNGGAMALSGYEWWWWKWCRYCEQEYKKPHDVSAKEIAAQMMVYISNIVSELATPTTPAPTLSFVVSDTCHRACENRGNRSTMDLTTGMALDIFMDDLESAIKDLQEYENISVRRVSMRYFNDDDYRQPTFFNFKDGTEYFLDSADRVVRLGSGALRNSRLNTKYKSAVQSTINAGLPLDDMDDFRDEVALACAVRARAKESQSGVYYDEHGNEIENVNVTYLAIQLHRHCLSIFWYVLPVEKMGFNSWVRTLSEE